MDDFIQDFQRRLASGEIELQPLIQGGKGSGNLGHSGIPGKVGGRVDLEKERIIRNQLPMKN